MIAGARKGATAVVAAGALLVLWLGACGSPTVVNAPSGPPASTSAQPAQPDTGGPATSPVPAAGDAAQHAQSPQPGQSTPGSAGAPSAGSSGSIATPAPTPPSASPAGNGSSPKADQNAAMDEASRRNPAAAPAAGPSVGEVASVSAYLVAIDDGGRSGVRFGCNDSLVAVRTPAKAGTDPLATALAALLDPAGSVAPPSGLYNALAASTLHFVSGYVDGSTAVVNLSGSLNPGGVCDNPRIEAQLTQTVVSATGASRAEIYVDGRTLGDILSLK